MMLSSGTNLCFGHFEAVFGTEALSVSEIEEMDPSQAREGLD